MDERRLSAARSRSHREERAASSADALSADADPVLDAETALERVTGRKVARRLLPLLFLLYITAYLDRTNVSIAGLQMNHDLGFSAAVYGFGAGIFFIGYALFEVPSNLILARVGARRWIARIAITWGLLASAMMFAHGPKSFYAFRFVLGVAEAGYFPGIIYYLGLWFPDRQRARAISGFMIGVPLSSVIGGPLGGALLSLDGRLGLAGWRWLFLLEGIPAVIFGVVALVYLTDSPEQASWLAPTEREWLQRRIEREQLQRVAAREGSVRGGLTRGVVWWLAITYLMVILASHGLILWLPAMVKEVLRVSNQDAGLITGVVGLAGVAGMLLNGRHSDRTGERIMHATLALSIAALGLVLAATIRDPVLTVSGFAIASFGFNAYLPVFWCLPSAFLRGVGAAGGIALVNSIGNVGGFAGPNVLGFAKTVTGSFAGGLLVLAGLSVGAALLLLPVRRAGALARQP